MTLRSTFLCLAVLACNGGDKNTDDTDTGATSDDTTGEDTDTEDTTTEDTDVADTDVEDTDVPVCTLTELPAATQLTATPGDGASYTFTRTIQACYDATGIRGSWLIDVRNEFGDRWCGFGMPFTSSTVASESGCSDCDVTYTSVVWGAATFSNAANCELFGYDADTETSIGASFTSLGVDESEPELLYPSKGWTFVDSYGTKTNVDEAGEKHYTSVWSYTDVF